jgi:hypothetical protein
MWSGTWLREFIRRPAALYLIGKEPQTTFDSFLGDNSPQPSLGRLNARCASLHGIDRLAVHLSIAREELFRALAAGERDGRLAEEA